MKITDIINAIKIKLTADPQKTMFMKELMQTAQDNEQYMNFLKQKTDEYEDKTQYLNELFEYWQSSGNLEIKIKNDMQKGN